MLMLSAIMYLTGIEPYVLDVGLELYRSTGSTAGICSGAVVEMPQACLLGYRCAMRPFDADAIGNDGELADMRLQS